jgi:hypothetical protein
VFLVADVTGEISMRVNPMTNPATKDSRSGWGRTGCSGIGLLQGRFRDERDGEAETAKSDNPLAVKGIC